MNTKQYFSYNPELELTVAQIGINKWDWECIQDKNTNQAMQIMISKSYDVLPIVSNGRVIEYYKTKNWGDFSSIEVRPIEGPDKLYYRLSFYDFLKRMIDEKREFYFLADSQEVLGLISLNNLNCLAVYNYIYQITSGLERRVTEMLKEQFSEDYIIDILSRTSDKSAAEILKEFNGLKQGNRENSIFDFLYFPTLSTILKYAIQDLPDKLKPIEVFRKKFHTNNVYGSLRNAVAHPVKPIFTSRDSISKVDELISDFYNIQEILDSKVSD